MLLRTLLFASVVLTTPAITAHSSPGPLDAFHASRRISRADSTPARFVAEAPIWGDDDAVNGYAFLPVKIEGKAATVVINLEDQGGLTLSAAALSRLGVQLDGRAVLDSLQIGKTVEHRLPVQVHTNAGWSEQRPPDLPPVIGVAGGQFFSHYDVEYNFPRRRATLYAIPPAERKTPGTWLPPSTKPADCAPMVTVPPGAGTFTGLKMKMNGHPVIGVIEMGPYVPKMNSNALQAMGLNEKSPEVTPIPPGDLPPGYTHNGHPVTQQVNNVKMSVGERAFSMNVQIFPSLDAEGVLGADAPIMLLNLNVFRGIVLVNSNSSRRVCVHKP